MGYKITVKFNCGNCGKYIIEKTNSKNLSKGLKIIEKKFKKQTFVLIDLCKNCKEETMNFEKMLNKLIDTIDCIFPCKIDECKPEQEKCRKCIKGWLQQEIELEEER